MSASRLRVLVLTYYWPPSGGSGVQRWLKFAKYLPAYGIDPVVVAPEEADYALRDESLLRDVPDGVEVLRVPIVEPYAAYRKLTGAGAGDRGSVSGKPGESPSLLKRLSRWVRANFFVPDPKVWWVRPTMRRLTAYLKEKPVDVVVSTGPPHSVHLIARALKETDPELKWILDVRDPWSQFDVHLSFGPGRRAIAKNEALERACLQAADIVLGTAYSMPSHLEPFDTSKYRTITNGYDAADFAGLPARTPASGRASFAVYHTGLLSAERNPTALWEAMACLAAGDAGFAERLSLHLIGNVAPEVTASIEALPELRDKLTVTPWLSHNELLRRYPHADCFLLLPNRSDNARGQINGKLFEYLAVGKPVLHVGPYDADNTRILDETHAGLTVPPGDVDGMMHAVRQLSSGAFARNEHALQPGRVKQFEREKLTGELATLIRQLAGRSANTP